ncbi:MAG: hypothetical protein ACLT76_01230 [Clostridium fessum]
MKGLEMVGVETKVLEIRPLQRISFFNDLYRSGFEAVVIDKGQENHMSMSLFSIIEEAKGYIRDRDEPAPVRSGQISSIRHWYGANEAFPNRCRI